MSKLICPKCGYNLKNDGNFRILMASLYDIIPVDIEDYTIDKDTLEEDAMIRCSNCEHMFKVFNKKKEE